MAWTYSDADLAGSIRTLCEFAFKYPKGVLSTSLHSSKIHRRGIWWAILRMITVLVTNKNDGIFVS